MSARLFLALLHHPVRDRLGRIVTSALTNMDVHDIARSARTFGVERFYVAHPVPALRALAERIVDHWQDGYGGATNPSRREAIGLAEVVPDLDHVVAAVEQRTGSLPLLVSTSAREAPGTVSFAGLRRILATESRPLLILFGTGYGLDESVLERCELRLEPISGSGAYNHLSVRSAAAILLDRLAGRRSEA